MQKYMAHFKHGQLKHDFWLKQLSNLLTKRTKRNLRAMQIKNYRKKNGKRTVLRVWEFYFDPNDQLRVMISQRDH